MNHLDIAHLDIGIAGCGPAGLACALLLHRGGHRVTLYEQFDEPRPIGSGLMIQPTGLAVLDRLGLAARTIAAGSRVERLLGLNENGKMVLDARYAELSAPGTFGIGIHRAQLFDLLYGAVLAAGITVRTQSQVARCTLDREKRILHFADGTASAPHDLVIDALGLHSPLAEATGRVLDYGALWATLDWPDSGPFDPHRLEQRYRAARQMVGVLPLGHGKLAFFWSIKAQDLPAWQASGLDEWKHKVLALWPECACLLEQISDADQLTFARYAHRTVPHPVSTRMVQIGDAWHSASPQLGQGANMALLDAWALSEGLRLGTTLPDALRQYHALRADHVKLYQFLTDWLTPLYQSDAALPAAVRDRLLAPVSRIWPVTRIQSALVAGLFGAPLPLLGLDVPDYGKHTITHLP
ncbi:MAG: FAD-dependent monooxygenase [Sphingomonadaceae bacterium]|nr:FAD-dependent monooxygenase [Sphingomonadaceae bacterium]